MPILRKLGSVLRLAAAVFLCLTPLTAVLVMGWLMTLMQRETVVQRRRLAQPNTRIPRPSLPNWLVVEEPRRGSLAGHLTGALRRNLRDGCAAFLTTAACVLPFGLLWLFSWWSGWDNSFQKGYEQSWVGPVIGLTGVVLALPLLTHLPMALARQAAEGRMSAFFAIGHVRRLIRQVGWRYGWLCFLTALASFPLFVFKGAALFVENWSPGFLTRNAEELQTFAQVYRFWATVYLVIAVVVLRGLAARIYARAAHRLETVPNPGSALGVALRTAMVWCIWMGLVVQVYVGQFLNHQWIAWLNQPAVALPWLPLPGALV